MDGGRKGMGRPGQLWSASGPIFEDGGRFRGSAPLAGMGGGGSGQESHKADKEQ